MAGMPYVCQDCGKECVCTEVEQSHFKENHWVLPPTRCRVCRKLHKARANADSGAKSAMFQGNSHRDGKASPVNVSSRRVDHIPPVDRPAGPNLVISDNKAFFEYRLLDPHDFSPHLEYPGYHLGTDGVRTRHDDYY